ncbi:MAG: TonB-dependent receptor [Bacteroidota bacterium]
MRTIFTFFAAIAILFPFATYAHNGSVRGIVYDATSNKPVEGASIYIKAANASAVTDMFGKFIIKGAEPGKYKIIVSHLGYEPMDENVKIEDGITTEVIYRLVATSVKMEAVSINAKKELVSASVSGIDLKLRPVNSTQDLLRLVPGLFIAQHQGGGKAEQIFLRGFDCDHGTDVNVSVDDMPVNMVSHAHGQGFADAHFIIPEAVQQVDYGKGPYQVDKGNFNTGGYVGMKTRNSLDNSFVKAEGGMYGFFRTAAGFDLLNKNNGNNSKQDAYVMGEYGYNRSYFDAPQNFNRFNLTGKYTNYLAQDKILSVTLSGFHSYWDASGQLPERAVDAGIVSRYGQLSPESGKTSRYNANLQYFQRINNSTYFKSNFYLTYYQFSLYSNFTFFAEDSINGDQIHQAESRVVAGYNSDLTTEYAVKGLKMKSRFGLGFRHDEIKDDELSHTVGQSMILDRIALGDVQESNIFGYANQSVYLLPQLVLDLGTRYDVLIQHYENKLPADKTKSTAVNGRLSPKAGLYYNFGNNARVYYNYGTGFHSNDTRTLAIGRQLGSSIIADNTIPQAFSHDLGVVVKPWSKLLLYAAIWKMDMQQEFGYVGDAAVIDTGGRTRRMGIDLSARYEATPWLYFDFDINYVHGRAIDQPEGSNYISLAPALTSVGGITVKPLKNFVTSLRYRHLGERPANDDYTLTAQGYTLFDAVINYSTRRYELGLQVQNLFNVAWREAQFATETRLASEVANGLPAVEDVCYTPGTPIFLKLTATYKF